MLAITVPLTCWCRGVSAAHMLVITVLSVGFSSRPATFQNAEDSQAHQAQRALECRRTPRDALLMTLRLSVTTCRVDAVDHTRATFTQGYAALFWEACLWGTRMQRCALSKASESKVRFSSQPRVLLPQAGTPTSARTKH